MKYGNNLDELFFNGIGPAPTSTSQLSGGAASGSQSGSGGSNPIGAIANAAASVINNTVSNLFQNKVYKTQADLLKAQAAEEQMKTRLMLLSNDQQNVLAAQLQQMNDDNAKAKLLDDTVVAITVAQLQTTAYNPNDIYVAGLQSSGTGAGNGAATSSASNTAASNQVKLAIIAFAGAVIVMGVAIMVKVNKVHNN